MSSFVPSHRALRAGLRGQSLKIHEENTDENHNRVGSIYVINIHVPLYVKKKFNFFGLRKINFQTLFAN